MKNNLNKNIESTNKKKLDTLKTQNSNILYKSYNNKKNKKKAYHSINNKELSDIKSIVKTSVEKIYDLFNLQEMKENSKILSRKASEITQLRNTLNDIENLNSTTIKKNEDSKFMKTDMNFKINNYLTVSNKNKNIPDGGIHTTLNYLEDEISYLHKRFKKNEIKKNNLNTLNNMYNLKKSKIKKKKLKKNNSSGSNFIKNKSDIKNNIIMSTSKTTKKSSSISDNDFLFFHSKRLLPINFEENKYNIITNCTNNKNDEMINDMTDKSIIVNTRYKKSDVKNNNYNNTIIPTRISHINKEEETMNNDFISNQSKDIKNNRDSKNSFKNNSEKKKKFIFLKRTKTKKNNEGCCDENTKNLFFSQQISKTNFHPSHSRVNSCNFNGEKYEFLGGVPKSGDKNYDIDYSPETENDLKLKKNDSKKSNLCINTKLDKTQTKNKKDKDNFNKNDKDINNKYINTTNKLVNINNILISGSNSTQCLSSQYKPDNKIKLLKNNKNKGFDKINSYYLLLESDIKNNVFSRNKKKNGNYKNK